MCLQLSRHGAAGGWLRAVHGALARQAQTTSSTIDPSTTSAMRSQRHAAYTSTSSKTTVA
jgi:hypothetical protein